MYAHYTSAHYIILVKIFTNLIIAKQREILICKKLNWCLLSPNLYNLNKKIKCTISRGGVKLQ